MSVASCEPRIVDKALALIASALFVCQSALATSLPAQLYEEGQWLQARREAWRLAVREPDEERWLMWGALAALQLDASQVESRHTAYQLAQNAANEAVRDYTALELGRIHWAQGQYGEAQALLFQVFERAANRDLFLQAAYQLDALQRHYPALATASPALAAQLATLRPLLSRTGRTAPPTPPRQTRRSWGRWITRRFVFFYQRQIGPAIGQRCSMYPSCSAYCLEACSRYGLLGIPMTADRLIRETDHVQQRIHPIMINGQERFFDPVSAHSFWFRRDP